MVELEKILLIYPNEIKAQEMLNSTRQTLTDNKIKEYYEAADTYVSQAEYDMAIEQWNNILQLDPNQEMASRLISSLHRKKLDNIYVEAEKLFAEGSYIASRDRYNQILADNPTDQRSKAITEKLTSVIKVVPNLNGAGKVNDLLRKGVTNFVSDKGNAKIAVASVWYAVQLEPDNTTALAMRDFIESNHLSIIRSMETPVKDMDLVEQYLFAALNHIYEGRYDLTIQECTLVLELEPENILALKRLGSAYYAMGRTAKARKTWKEALELAPKDEELKGFLRQTK